MTNAALCETIKSSGHCAEDSTPQFKNARCHKPGLLVCGLNHVRASLSVRELYALSPDRCQDVLELIRARRLASQALVLSTCNRTEIYVYSQEQQYFLRELFLTLGGENAVFDGPPPIYQYQDLEAVRHLFAVASGLDSMILGENQIKQQLRKAAELSARTGCEGPELHRIIEAAFHTGKRIRTETELNTGTLGLGKAAVLQGEKELGSLAGRACLIIGAGKIGRLAAEALADRKPRHLWIVNRSPSRAAEIVEQVGGEAFGLEALPHLLPRAELILGMAYAPDLLLTRQTYVQCCPENLRPKLVCMVDIAMPRILDTGLGKLTGVKLHNMEAMEQIAQENYSRRLRASAQAWKIVEEEVERYRAARRTVRWGEPIKRMESRLDKVLKAESALIEKLVPPLMVGQIEEHQRRLRQRLLHEFIQEMKALS